MTNIIGFLGCKESGKSTAANFLFGIKLAEFGICDTVKFDDNGYVLVSDLFGQTTDNKEDFFYYNENVSDEAKSEIHKLCKIYAIADKLKDLCVNYFGLTQEQVRGTNAQKNTLTNLKWEDMPFVLTPDRCGFMFQESSMGSNSVDDIVPPITDTEFIDWVNSKKDNSFFEWNGFILHKPGRMSAREVMQYVGTNIFRKMNINIWIDAVLQQITQDNPMELALISDVRFLNEVDAIQRNKGIVIGLTRNSDRTDNHASELEVLEALKNADYIIDNKNMSLAEVNDAILEIIKVEMPHIMPNYA